MIEKEIKLSASPSDWQAVKDNLLSAEDIQRIQSITIPRFYCDTDDLVLHEHDMILRLWPDHPSGQTLQCIKWLADDAPENTPAGQFTRHEEEVFIDQNHPDLSVIPDALQNRWPDIAADDLRPLFSTTVTRRRVKVDGVLLTFDQGDIHVIGTDVSEPISEIEVELIKATLPSDLLDDWAEKIQSVSKARPFDRPKSQRGYALIEKTGQSA
jgi:inorganic triphosphatase YgiF